MIASIEELAKGKTFSLPDGRVIRTSPVRCADCQVDGELVKVADTRWEINCPQCDNLIAWAEVES